MTEMAFSRIHIHRYVGVPGPRGVTGNEIAGAYARQATEELVGMAFLKRRTEKSSKTPEDMT